MKRLLVVAVIALAGSAWAEVGKVLVVEEATRAGADGKAAKLEVGTPIELGDTLEVKKGNLKLELTDGSVIMLSEKSKLVIKEADFAGQERKGFSAFLEAGKLWTRVKAALGGAKYEVTTERAVAGVRGTIFRIDADALVKGARGGKARNASIVRVTEGVVAVKPSDAVARASTAQLKPAAKGERKQVPGPTEITADEWEKKFVELQKGQQLAVGVDLWEQAEIEAAAKNDAFSKWIEKNQ